MPWANSSSREVSEDEETKSKALTLLEERGVDTVDVWDVERERMRGSGDRWL